MEDSMNRFCPGISNVCLKRRDHATVEENVATGAANSGSLKFADCLAISFGAGCSAHLNAAICVPDASVSIRATADSTM